MDKIILYSTNCPKCKVICKKLQQKNLDFTEIDCKADTTYIEMLKRVMKLDFTHFITGHLMTVFEKKIFEHYLEVAIEAKPENSERVTFHNFERPNTFQYAKKF